MTSHMIVRLFQLLDEFETRFIFLDELHQKTYFSKNAPSELPPEDELTSFECFELEI